MKTNTAKDDDIATSTEMDAETATSRLRCDSKSRDRLQRTPHEAVHGVEELATSHRAGTTTRAASPCYRPGPESE